MLARKSLAMKTPRGQNVGAAIKQMSDLLSQQMDKLVMNLDEEYPDFVATYFSDRMVINTAIRHRKKADEEAEAAKIADVSEGKKPGDLSIAI